MRAEDHILNDIKPLSITEKVASILDLMEELKFCHLPVLDQGKYVGLIGEDDLLDIQEEDDTLDKHLKVLKPYRLRADDHLFNAMHVIGEGNLSLLPVVREEQQYIGFLSPLEMVQDLGRQLTFQEPGALIVLRTATLDYHLSQLTQIVESEDAHIIGFHLVADGPDHLEIILKINRTDISRIIKAFERFEYEIKAVFHRSIFDDTASDRYDSLMNYLNI